jgi:hypothetical protein
VRLLGTTALPPRVSGEPINSMKYTPEQRVSILLEVDGRGGVLLQEIYTCTNSACPEETHEYIARTPLDGIAVLQHWLDQLLVIAPPQGRG